MITIENFNILTMVIGIVIAVFITLYAISIKD